MMLLYPSETTVATCRLSQHDGTPPDAKGRDYFTRTFNTFFSCSEFWSRYAEIWRVSRRSSGDAEMHYYSPQRRSLE
jgi:hypothetical protein